MIIDRIITFPDHPGFVTSFNPADMVELGIFNNDFTFLSIKAGDKLLRDGSILGSNFRMPLEDMYPIKSVSDFYTELEEVVKLDQIRTFFNWYILYYYRIGDDLNFEINRDMIKKRNEMLEQIYKLRSQLGTRDLRITHCNQRILELGWNPKKQPIL